MKKVWKQIEQELAKILILQFKSDRSSVHIGPVRYEPDNMHYFGRKKWKPHQTVSKNYEFEPEAGPTRGASGCRHGFVYARIESDGGRRRRGRPGSTVITRQVTPKVQAAITPFHLAPLGPCHLHVVHRGRSHRCMSHTMRVGATQVVSLASCSVKWLKGWLLANLVTDELFLIKY